MQFEYYICLGGDKIVALIKVQNQVNFSNLEDSLQTGKGDRLLLSLC